MAFILVTMKLQNIPGKRMGYPKIYNDNKVGSYIQGPIVFEGAFSRGEDEEKCLLCIADELAKKVASDPEGRIQIISEAEADAWLAANKQLATMPEEQVTDANRLLIIQTKAAAKIPLNKEDRDALDPDKPTRGISRKRKTCKDIFGG